ncbi:hypothetical protein PsorP6_007531 [Peronosclerospora sorghi]|uniref:Uncharacterized protein n=1 Tax=Peronosclerospora sorghi TaxID=230839 RepID=A0ACC0WAC0_9STRA|nr:hypothetical protein PsorP6_007531 [Peronosclerospora sorghi]
MTVYLPKNNISYKDKGYWDSRFDSEESYDWLVRFENVAGLLGKYLRPSDRILMVNGFSLDTTSHYSLFPLGWMRKFYYNAGFHHITNIDFSEVVIKRMSAKYSERMPEMLWLEADMTKLCDVFEAQSFDVVIDKAAMDALMCDEGDVWSPTEAVIEQAHAMCSGITSLLTPQGTFLQISFAQPHFRKRFLLGRGEQASFSSVYGWSFAYHNISTLALAISMARSHC